MKRLLLILFLVPTLAFAQNATDGGKVPLNGNQIGGVGSDNAFHFLHINNDGSLSITTGLPTGAATSAKQDTGNTSLASIDTKLPAKGQATMANSVPVVIASDQTAVPVTGTVTVPAGAAYTVGPTVLQNAATATGNGTAMTVTGVSTIGLQTSGTFSATIVFEATVDGTNWVNVTATRADSNFGTVIQTGNTGGLFRIPVSGYAQFRARISSYASGSVTVTAIGIADGSTSNVVTFSGGSTTTSDGIANGSWFGPWTTQNGATGQGIPSAVFWYNGATWDRVRVASLSKTATATASGDTAVWTPTSGKKVRLMRYQIQVTADSSISGGGVLDVVLRDATTATAGSYSVYLPAVAATGFGNSASSGWVDLGNGILSAAANNVLNVNLSAALASGKVRVIAAGTEE